MHMTPFPLAFVWIGLGLSISAISAAAQGPEKPFELSPLQQRLVDAVNQWVMPPEDRPTAKRNYVRLKMLSFNPRTDVTRQIEAYENQNRRGYDPGPFYVRDTQGRTGAESGGETWFREVFMIEKDWAKGLKVPYFCELLQLKDAQGKRVELLRGNEQQYVKLSQEAVRSILQPLAEAPADELAQTACYVVRYIGNFEGNAKYVKLYVGKPGTADFVVIDVSVYDHY